MKKRGMEMVISTLVVIILGLLMLVMGIILISTSMCKAKQGVTSMADLSAQEIQNLFSQQDNVVAVKKITNEISKESYFGVGFAIENEGKSSNTNFKYTVSVLDLGDCQITKANAESYIVTGKSATVTIPIGDTYSDIIEFNIPKATPICSLKYIIKVDNGGASYGSSVFEVRIKNPSFVSSLIC
jgi:hypothetical protein